MEKLRRVLAGCLSRRIGEIFPIIGYLNAFNTFCRELGAKTTYPVGGWAMDRLNLDSSLNNLCCDRMQPIMGW